MYEGKKRLRQYHLYIRIFCQNKIIHLSKKRACSITFSIFQALRGCLFVGRFLFEEAFTFLLQVYI